MLFENKWIYLKEKNFLKSFLCDMWMNYLYLQFKSVQSLSPISLTPWTAVRQASLPITNYWSLLKLMSIELVMPSNHLILCRPLLLLLWVFPSIRFFPVSQFFASGGQSIETSASASIPPMNIQDWFPLGLTGLISLQSRGLSRVFSNTTVQKHQFSQCLKHFHSIYILIGHTTWLAGS